MRQGALFDMKCLIVQAELRELRELREKVRQFTESKNSVRRLNTLFLSVETDLT